MSVNWILMFQFPKPSTISKHALFFRFITHLIKFWFLIKIWIEMPFTYFALFIIFIKHQFFLKFETKFLFVPSWLWPCIAIYLVKKFKNHPTIKGGKLWIPFIQLNIKPTSTPSPKRDQLVCVIDGGGRESWVRHMICQQANKRVGSVAIVDFHLVIISLLWIGSLLDF